MMLYWEFPQVYIGISNCIIVKNVRWFLVIQTVIKTCVLWWAGMCHLCILLQKEWSLCCYEGVKWLLSFKKVSLIINPKGTVSGAILSLTTEVTCISVFPGFWKCLPIILVQELLRTASAAYIDSLFMLLYALYAGHDSCRLWGLAVASVDGCCLYIIIHNCLLHGTWL